ncbi:MAG TPA: tRNA 2-thiouridine(34) synthase MnmA [Candidatus Polarisedimenticolia bacterium]|nr:tRNA 2-thiouridine(34) synthase MnmA [Candidatus Polarisedimenticolia bacterium]
MARVVAGMSGGVDSSVAAALLARQGHEVIGVSLQLHDLSQAGRAARCCSPEDFLDARRVCSQLGIPYYVVDREELFGWRVLDHFAGEYRAGRTPNPCVRCNADVKFEELGALARSLGAGAVATGHYARLTGRPGQPGRALLRASDREKDQSYFLFDLTDEQRALALFPLGGMSKAEVRREAVSLGLATACKPESQDICFLEGTDYRGFLRARQEESGEPPEAPGEMVDTTGRVLGRHGGVSGFTVGQRRGLGVSSARRLYVVQVDAASRRVVLAEEDALLCGALELTGIRLASPPPGPGPFPATVKVRHRHHGTPARVTCLPDGGGLVELLEPVRGVSPGQAAVFYDQDLVIGGGWIAAARPAGSVPAAAAAALP